jgi:2-phospho-L-lactate guanylyltransferase
MRTVAILPVKRFGIAKQRLSDGLEPATREALVQAMFTDVLRSLRPAGVDEIVVVTASPVARQIAGESGATVIEDQETGHNDAAMLGIRAAIEKGAERVLLVPGDCPVLDTAEVDALLAMPTTPPSALIVPDRHGTGTNALLITPPDALTPSFGSGSRRRHATLAAERGVNAEIVEVPSLALDIDTPADLAALAATPDQAGSTRRLLRTC